MYKDSSKWSISRVLFDFVGDIFGVIRPLSIPELVPKMNNIEKIYIQSKSKKKSVRYYFMYHERNFFLLYWNANDKFETKAAAIGLTLHC